MTPFERLELLHLASGQTPRCVHGLIVSLIRLNKLFSSGMSRFVTASSRMATADTRTCISHSSRTFLSSRSPSRSFIKREQVSVCTWRAHRSLSRPQRTDLWKVSGKVILLLPFFS